MKILNETNPDLSSETAIVGNPRIGNKLDILFDSTKSLLVGNIHKIVATSFIDQAKKGTLMILQNNDLNFNKRGEYKIAYAMLDSLYLKMTGIKSEYVRFSFVEIDKTKHPLELDTYSPANNTLIYIAISLQDRSNKTIDEHNYFVMNADKNVMLEDLKISNSELLDFQNNYEKNYLNVLNKYFSHNGRGNTQTIDYHIGDIEDLLNNNKGVDYTVHLAEITDIHVLGRLNNLEINENVYNEHFKGREKQLTMILVSEDDFFDMGSLQP